MRFQRGNSSKGKHVALRQTQSPHKQWHVRIQGHVHPGTGTSFREAAYPKRARRVF